MSNLIWLLKAQKRRSSEDNKSNTQQNTRKTLSQEWSPQQKYWGASKQGGLRKIERAWDSTVAEATIWQKGGRFEFHLWAVQCWFWPPLLPWSQIPPTPKCS